MQGAQGCEGIYSHRSEVEVEPGPLRVGKAFERLAPNRAFRQAQQRQRLILLQHGGDAGDALVGDVVIVEAELRQGGVAFDGL